MIRPLKIAHTSDVHLHDGQDGQHVRDAFARVVDTVLDARSDLFLIAGDLFDDNRIQGEVIDDPESDRSSLITPQEIADSGFDYLALGHVHVHRQMRHGNTLACYPGVPAPYYGTTQSAHVTLVQLTPGAGVCAVALELDSQSAHQRKAGAAATRKLKTD